MAEQVDEEATMMAAFMENLDTYYPTSSETGKALDCNIREFIVGELTGLMFVHDWTSDVASLSIMLPKIAAYVSLLRKTSPYCLEARKSFIGDVLSEDNIKLINTTTWKDEEICYLAIILSRALEVEAITRSKIIGFMQQGRLPTNLTLVPEEGSVDLIEATKPSIFSIVNESIAVSTNLYQQFVDYLFDTSMEVKNVPLGAVQTSLIRRYAEKKANEEAKTTLAQKMKIAAAEAKEKMKKKEEEEAAGVALIKKALEAEKVKKLKAKKSSKAETGKKTEIVAKSAPILSFSPVKEVPALKEPKSSGQAAKGKMMTFPEFPALKTSFMFSLTEEEKEDLRRAREEERARSIKEKQLVAGKAVEGEGGESEGEKKDGEEDDEEDDKENDDEGKTEETDDETKEEEDDSGEDEDEEEILEVPVKGIPSSSKSSKSKKPKGGKGWFSSKVLEQASKMMTVGDTFRGNLIGDLSQLDNKDDKAKAFKVATDSRQTEGLKKREFWILHKEQMEYFLTYGKPLVYNYLTSFVKVFGGTIITEQLAATCVVVLHGLGKDTMEQRLIDFLDRYETNQAVIIDDDSVQFFFFPLVFMSMMQNGKDRDECVKRFAYYSKNLDVGMVKNGPTRSNQCLTRYLDYIPSFQVTSSSFKLDHSHFEILNLIAQAPKEGSYIYDATDIRLLRAFILNDMLEVAGIGNDSLAAAMSLRSTVDQINPYDNSSLEELLRYQGFDAPLVTRNFFRKAKEGNRDYKSDAIILLTYVEVMGTTIRNKIGRMKEAGKELVEPVFKAYDIKDTAPSRRPSSDTLTLARIPLIFAYLNYKLKKASRMDSKFKTGIANYNKAIIFPGFAGLIWPGHPEVELIKKAHLLSMYKMDLVINRRKGKTYTASKEKVESFWINGYNSSTYDDRDRSTITTEAFGNPVEEWVKKAAKAYDDMASSLEVKG
nr:MAG: nucleocapsid protein [Pseudoscorpian peribunya-like virus]